MEFVAKYTFLKLLIDIGDVYKRESHVMQKKTIINQIGCHLETQLLSECNK